tara:strand:+ start:54 stop:275 length:222 start_codon:yes stop_codon:yes gene_type:complete
MPSIFIRNKVALLVVNIVASLLWGNIGANFFIVGIEQLGIDRYFSVELWVAFNFLVIFMPPLWMTWYIWLRRK